VRELESKIADQKTLSQSVSTTTTGHGFDLNGLWDSDQGIQYLIEQDGNRIVLQEINPLLGITAEGEGRLNGRRIQLSYVTALGTSGNARLTVEDDADTLSGVFSDLTTGVTLSIELYR